MKYCILGTISLLILILEVQGQEGCIRDSSRPVKLELDGRNFTLIDNALLSFKVNSISEIGDTIMRIWLLDVDQDNKPSTWRVRMFEFGEKWDIPVAKLYSLEWGFSNADHSFPIKCIKEQQMIPKPDWGQFEKALRGLNLRKIYKVPYLNKGTTNVDFGMMIFQFIDGYTTYNVDYTGLIDISDTANALQIEHSKRIAYLFWYIEKYFNLNLTTDWNGNDYLQKIKEHLKMK